MISIKIEKDTFKFGLKSDYFVLPVKHFIPSDTTNQYPPSNL